MYNTIVYVKFAYLLFFGGNYEEIYQSVGIITIVSADALCIDRSVGDSA